MFSTKSNWVASIVLVSLVLMLSSCGRAPRPDLERGIAAGNALKSAETQIDQLRSTPSIASTDRALESIDQYVAQPDLLPVPVRRDSFSVTDPRETRVPGSSAFMQMLGDIAYAYELNNRWDKACETWNKAIVFAQSWNKSHTARVSDSSILCFYSDLARAYWRGGKRDEAMKTIEEVTEKHLPAAGREQSALLVQLVYYASASKNGSQLRQALRQVDSRVHELEGSAANYRAGRQLEKESVCRAELNQLRSDVKAAAEMKSDRIDALPSMEPVLSLGRRRALEPDRKIFRAPLLF